MRLFDHIRKFVLMILDKEFYTKVFGQKGPFERLWQTNVLGFYLNARYIAGDWKQFWEYYNPNKNHLVFRGIATYNASTLRSLLKSGNERYKLDPQNSWDQAVYSKYNLKPQDFIWATPDLTCAMSMGGRERHKSILLVAYDSRLLELVGESIIYKLKEGVNSFRDALSAIVLIYLRF